MTNPIEVTNTGTGASTPVIVDPGVAEFALGLSMEVTGTSSSRVEYSLDYPWAAYASSYGINASWHTIDSLSGTASVVGRFETPCYAVRLNTVAHTSGSVRLVVLQPGRLGAP